ncbi:hypothetical protein [Streptantibioticus ferralitis]|uniref:Proteinase inhibitor I42 chagasin domain-containing protein n=1 Tax=Streptantibioticus ferralitis TaxID=236510 RepID=A0ABT5YYQ1_9ACTN|nr:hypothetical protein [Streptantibioticus ferralitis]MDF2256679.1 hypothetical protein [Streptantibioticus ferralitis]
MRSARFTVTGFAAGLALSATAICVPVPASAAPHRDRPEKAVELALSNSDDGRAVTVHRGGVITVRLTGSHHNGLTWTWSLPSAADGRVLRRTGTVTSPGGVTRAALRAAGEGSTAIDSFERCVPDPGHLCPHVVRRWAAMVTVR